MPSSLYSPGINNNLEPSFPTPRSRGNALGYFISRINPEFQGYKYNALRARNAPTRAA